MAEPELPRDLFGNPIAERSRRRRAAGSCTAGRPDKSADVNAAKPSLSATLNRPVHDRHPVRLYLPSKWPYISLIASFAIMVAAAALKIPLAKTPVVELDLTSLDDRTTVGLMSFMVVAAAIWSAYEALFAASLNVGLKTSRRPIVCARKWLKVGIVAIVTAGALCISVGFVWFTWKYTHPQIRHVTALLLEFGRNPPGETGSIPEPDNPNKVPWDIGPAEPPTQIDGFRDGYRPRSKGRQRVQTEAREKDWMQEADQWLLDLFAPPAEPRKSKRPKGES